MGDALSLFHQYKKLGEDAIGQISDEDLTRTISPEVNSIAIIVKHMAGHMRSRWTDFLTSDGEKPDRDRDSEFRSPPASRGETMALWEDGWRRAFAALGELSDADLSRIVRIRNEPFTVLEAVNRQIAHYSYHCGQIVLLAKHFAGSRWKSLSAPKKR